LLVTLAISPADAFLDFDFDALLLVMAPHQLIGQSAKDQSRTVFEGQFPFP
jgi:hypothetical protein